MSIHAASFDHRVYILGAVVTHALVGFTLTSVYTRSNALAGVVGAVLPDVDLLFSPAWQFPFVHRGLTHTPMLAAFVVAPLVVGRRYRSALGVAVGYLSHLVVDSLTQSGIMWLYPVATTPFGVDARVHATRQTAVIWALVLAIWLRYWYRNLDRTSETGL
jgi:inner membrane protein